MKKDKKFTFDLSVDAWINGLEIEAETYDDALESLHLMSLDELIEKGYVKDFDLKNIDYEVEEDEEEYLEGEELKDLISKRIPGYMEDGLTDLDDLVEKLEAEAEDEHISFSWMEAREMIKDYLEEPKEEVDA